MRDTGLTPELLKILGNDVRWKLVSALAQSDLRVQELVAVADQPQNLVSYHLKQLKQVQLVVERRSSADARDIYYSLDIEHLEAHYRALGRALHPALGSRNNVVQSSARVLFLCTLNSARSQMAEALLRRHGGASITVASAGTEPASVHPTTLRILREMGLETAHLQAKSVSVLSTQPFDYVITVCDRARESCPTFSGETTLIHWSIPDPVAVTGNELERFRAFQDTARQIEKRVHYFLAQLKDQEFHV